MNTENRWRQGFTEGKKAKPKSLQRLEEDLCRTLKGSVIEDNREVGMRQGQKMVTE